MAEPAPRRLLFISNGHGEDSIAAAIIRRLPQGVAVDAYPTLGDGRAYDGVCTVVGPRARLASEGWRNVRGSVARDLAGGGLKTLLPGIRFARSLAGRYDRVVVVGDLVGVGLCWLAGLRNIVWLDVYRTGYGRLYSSPERWLIGRTVGIAFCRADRLAGQLRAAGLDARAAGNVMMDTVTYGDYDVAARRSRGAIVALLPGSRQFTAANFARQVAALRLIPAEVRPDVFLALAGGIDLDELAALADLSAVPHNSDDAVDAGTLTDGDLLIRVARGAAGNLMAAADVVLSQAGTATVQALGLGRPVLTFVAAEDRPSRVRDESALFGDARQVVSDDPAALAGALRHLLDDPAERARRGAIGRARIGPPGAIDAIVAAITAPQGAVRESASA